MRPDLAEALLDTIVHIKNGYEHVQCQRVHGLPHYASAAVVGAMLVFAPCNADAVGVFDTDTNTFDANR